MKVSAWLWAAVAAVTLCAVGGVLHAAEPGAAAQKGPNFYRLGTDAAAEKACTDKGGAVSTDQDGNRICTLARACPAPGGAISTAKLDTTDATAAKKCQDACGVVSTDKNGAAVCTKPAG